MKKIAFLAILATVSFLTSANENLRFKGTYHFNSANTQVVSKKRIELVVTNSDEGQERVRELRALNYICLVRTARLTECSKFRPGTTHLNQLAIDRHNTRFLDATITFEDGDFAPVIVNDAEAVKEYVYKQKVVFYGDYYGEYRMQVTPTLTKLNFGTPTEKTLSVSESGELLLQGVVTIIESHLVSEVFILESKFIHE